MLRQFGLILAMAALVSAATPAPSQQSKPKTKSDGAWHMTPVRSIQARIQNDPPKWDEQAKRFYTPFAKDYAQGYQMALDGANTGSIEGALMFMQAEGIDVRVQTNKCERKNNMSYVVFYDITFAQPNASLAEFQDSDHPEYGPMLAFDGGKCSKQGDNFPKECLMMNGEQNTADIGPYIGGTLKETDPRAPYPDNYWFSFPSSCPTLGWKDDKAECRKRSHRVLCDENETPDGVNCVFNYKIVGYLGLDDLVGITADNKFKNYREFCEAGNIEFKTDEAGEVTENIAFWKDPKDQKANQARTEKMLTEYDNLVQGTSTINTMVPADIVKHFTALPKPEELAAKNPECYKNAFQCSTKGCKRTGYSQICKPCSDGNDCKSPPSGFSFPKLEKAVAPDAPNGGSGSKSNSNGNKSGSKGKSADGKGKNAAATAQPLAVATTLLAAGMMMLMQ